ncbi:MAG: type I secretion system permease/ATPase [Gammaproteobacteria bacterium]
MSNQRAELQESGWELPGDGLSFDDPLLRCLVLLTKLQHRPFSPDALSAGLPLVNHRLTPELFVRAAARAGLSARIIKRPLAKISILTLPAVLLLNDQHACVVLEINTGKGSARILQPEAGEAEQEVRLVDLGRDYLGHVIFVWPEHRFDERTPEVLHQPTRHWFWGTLSQSWRIYRDVLVASLLINIFALASPLFTMNVYDRVVPNGAIETLWVLALGVTIVFVFEAIMRALRGYFIDLAGKKADVLLSAMIFEKVLGFKMEARPLSVGAFASNLREFEGIRDFITSATITAIIDLPFLILFLLVIALIGGPLAIIPVVGIALVAIYGFFIIAPLRKSIENTYRASAQKNATLIESLTGMETIKTLGAEGTVQRKWEQAVGYIAHWGVRSRLLSSSAVNVSMFVQQLATVAIVIFGVYLIVENGLTMGGLIACVLLSGRAMAPMGQVASLATRYHQTQAALEGLNSIMALPMERDAEKSFVHRPRLDGRIEFHDISFAYPRQVTDVLSGVSFNIARGEHVAIIGRVGSGKTTLEKLIMGLYEPSKGAVRIDGIDVRQIDPADLRRNIGYVSQDIMLFFGTVRKNITLGAPHADDKTLLHAAEIAGVTEFVNRHPLGFDMPVGERGEGLSGGQRQAISIARSLILNPPILVMDEPSNSMDNTSEERLKTRMAEIAQNKTLVLVTHRASMLDLVTRLIVIDNGKIVADGPKERVLEVLKQGNLHATRR